jgi:hypothetical protein
MATLPVRPSDGSRGDTGWLTKKGAEGNSFRPDVRRSPGLAAYAHPLVVPQFAHL